MKTFHPISSIQSAGVSDEDLRRIDIVSLLCENSPIFLSELGGALKLNRVSIAGGLKTWIEGFSSLFEIRPLPGKDQGFLCGWTGKDVTYWKNTPARKKMLFLPRLSVRAKCDGTIFSVDIDADNRHRRVRIIRATGIPEDHFIPLIFKVSIRLGYGVKTGDYLINDFAYTTTIHTPRFRDVFTSKTDVSASTNTLATAKTPVDFDSPDKSQHKPLDTVAVGERRKGTVKEITELGAFVDIGGIDGFVHVSEFSRTNRFARVSDILKVGDEVDVVVLSIDKVNQMIRLGLSQTEKNPWDGIAERYPVGTRVKGKVRNFTSYGAFVQLEDGIDGMIHVSDMSWTRKINHPTELLQKGQEVEAVVLEVDSANQRISLGLKQAQEDPWTTITSSYQVGQKVKGKVSKIASFGAFVELEGGVDGLVHISQISEEHVEKVKDALKIGQEVEARIVRIDRDERRIGLSLREKNNAEVEVSMSPINIVGLASSFDVVTDAIHFFKKFPMLVTSCPQRTYLIARLIFKAQQAHSGNVDMENLLTELNEQLPLSSKVAIDDIWSILPESLFSQAEEAGHNQLCGEVVEYGNVHQWVKVLSEQDVLNLWKDGGQGHQIPFKKTMPDSKGITTSEESAVYSFWEALKKSEWTYSLRDIIRFHTSVRCEPLTILGGAPGSGKSSLARLYASYFGLGEDSQFLQIDVQPSWHDRMDFLGFVKTHGDTTVFEDAETGMANFLRTSTKQTGLRLVCLEEINLARPEHYFADFLQRISLDDNKREGSPIAFWAKGGEPIESFQLSKYVRFVGTCNFDETTQNFSARFLDRCNYIEFSPRPLKELFSSTEPKDITEQSAWDWTPYSTTNSSELVLNQCKNAVLGLLQQLTEFKETVSPPEEADNAGSDDNPRNLLKDLGLIPSSRAIQGILRYVYARVSAAVDIPNLKNLSEEEKNRHQADLLDRAVDEAVVQRLLPKMLSSQVAFPGTDVENIENRLLRAIGNKYPLSRSFIVCHRSTFR